MDMILSVVQYFIDLGAAVMLPLVIFVIAILLGTPLSRAVKSGICKNPIYWILSFALSKR